jgi:hypothetical protein
MVDSPVCRTESDGGTLGSVIDAARRLAVGVDGETLRAKPGPGKTAERILRKS